MTLRTQYESLMSRWALYPADYTLFRITSDGPAKGWPRILLQALWISYTLGLVSMFALLHAPASVAIGMAIGALLVVKVTHVVTGIYRFDPLDWMCDVGACGTAGALIGAHLWFATHEGPWKWTTLFVVWLLSFPWSSP